MPQKMIATMWWPYFMIFLALPNLAKEHTHACENSAMEQWFHTSRAGQAGVVLYDLLRIVWLPEKGACWMTRWSWNRVKCGEWSSHAGTWVWLTSCVDPGSWNTMEVLRGCFSSVSLFFKWRVGLKMGETVSQSWGINQPRKSDHPNTR